MVDCPRCGSSQTSRHGRRTSLGYRIDDHRTHKPSVIVRRSQSPERRATQSELKVVRYSLCRSGAATAKTDRTQMGMRKNESFIGAFIR